jgi:phosphoserine phosphatase
MSIYTINKLITDFDETVSEADTIQPLVRAAVATHGQRAKQLRADWAELVEWYTTQHRCIADEWLFNDNHQASCVNLVKAFDALHTQSVGRIIKGQLLAGLSREELRELGRQAQKREGVESVFVAMQSAGVTIEILSANLSQTLVEGAMEGLCARVVSNRLILNGNRAEHECTPRSTGEIQLDVVSSRDKQRHFRERRSRTGRTAYVGDSIFDLLAMQDADIGVLIGQNRYALRALERCRIPVATIDDNVRQPANPGTIVHVNSWKTLDAFLRRTDRRTDRR